MGLELLTERYASQIAGVLSCYDQIIIRGTLPNWCYAKGMTDYCYAHKIPIFDYPKWAQPLREAIRENDRTFGGGERNRNRIHSE
jgi:hypothetical protein